MGQAIATVVAAVIGAAATVVATRFHDIVDLFRPSRSIKGVWDGDVYLVGSEFRQDGGYDQQGSPQGRYVATLKQSGRRISGNMTMTETLPGVPLFHHRYRGAVKDEFFVYELSNTDRESFRISTALLHIDDTGRAMSGYFVANPGPRDPGRTLVGYTSMRKRT